jgi:hypothetical protein
VTIAIRPSLVEAGWQERTTDFGKTEVLFFARGLNRPNHVEAAREIDFSAQPFLPARRAREARIIDSTPIDSPVGPRSMRPSQRMIGCAVTDAC